MGRTPFEVVHGYTPDISLYVTHDWYDFVWWYDLNEKSQKLGRWLGPIHQKFGGGDCFYVLHKTGKLHVTNSVSYVKADEWRDRDIARQMAEIDIAINNSIGDKVVQPVGTDELPVLEDEFEGFEDSDEPAEPEALMPDDDDYTPKEYDDYIGVHVLLPIGSEHLTGIVKRRHQDAERNLYGKQNANPILDTRKYEVQMPDGSVETYGANIIAENIMSQVDDEGNMFVLLDEILDHKRESTALTEADAYFTTKTGRKRMKATTVGWKLLVSWKDRTSSWVRLAVRIDAYVLKHEEFCKMEIINHLIIFNQWGFSCVDT